MGFTRVSCERGRERELAESASLWGAGTHIEQMNNENKTSARPCGDDDAIGGRASPQDYARISAPAMNLSARGREREREADSVAACAPSLSHTLPTGVRLRERAFLRHLACASNGQGLCARIYARVHS